MVRLLWILCLFQFFIMLKIATINVRGINDLSKRNFLFRKLLKSQFDIICLQEVFGTPDRARLWQQEWPGQSLWNSRGTSSAGVAILFNPKIKPELSEFETDFNGRVLAINVELQGLKLRLINRSFRSFRRSRPP